MEAGLTVAKVPNTKARPYTRAELLNLLTSAAQRARDLPTLTPQACANAVLLDLGLDEMIETPFLVEYHAEFAYCRVCGLSPASHIGGHPCPAT